MAVVNVPMELEERCWNCQGTGTDSNEECEWCGGVGYKTTKFGDAVLEFLKHHLPHK